MRVEIVGSGEAFSTGLGNNSCLLHLTRTSKLLVDCGYQIPERLWQEPYYRSIDGIYLSHTHADHAFGIVPLITRYHLERRTRPLTILGHSGVASYCRKALDIGYPGLRERVRFPIIFQVTKPESSTLWNGLRFSVAKTKHTLRNYAARIESVKSGKVFCFSGDGEPTAASLNLYRGADLLVHEAFAWTEDIPGHSSAAKILPMLSQLQIKKILLTHFGREFRRKLILNITKLGKSRGEVLIAEPGKQFQL